MSVKSLFASALCCCFILCLLPGSAASMEIEEGLWEITTKTEMKGMPFSMPESKHTQCLTKEEFIPKPDTSAGNCKMIKTKVDGNTGEWVMECHDDKIKMKSTGKLTYAGNRFEGVITTVIDDPDMGKMEMSQQLSGRRIGECE